MSIDKNKKTHAPMRGNRGGHGVVMAGEKAKDFKGTTKRLLKYLKPHKVKLISVIFIFKASKFKLTLLFLPCLTIAFKLILSFSLTNKFESIWVLFLSKFIFK